MISDTVTKETSFDVDTFDYHLPEDRIAKYPLDRRDASKMLCLNRKKERIEHRQFNELPEILSPGDLIVINNTRVLPVRLFGNRQEHSGTVEIFLLYPTQENPHHWHVLMRPAKKLKPGTIIELNNTETTIKILENLGEGKGIVEICLSNEASVEALLENVGQMPIPPYLRREAEKKDQATYQTVFAKVPGSQAAPTAGLHFTPELMERLKAKGIGISELTLSVSSGTFRPVEVNDLRHHQMDPEHYELTQDTVDAIEETKARGNRVIAIGTTVTKTLETIATGNNGKLKAISGWSELYIYPGYEFKVIDGLLTNFHLPKSTLLMLVSAFSSRELILKAYKEAVENDYRFYSYGDCMLLI